MHVFAFNTFFDDVDRSVSSTGARDERVCTRGLIVYRTPQDVGKIFALTADACNMNAIFVAVNLSEPWR